MSHVKIYVSRDPQTNELRLRDSEGHEGDESIVTDVHAGDEIEWIAEEGIDEIKGIRPAAGSQTILRDCVKKENGAWQAKVSESAEGSEEYVIEYEADSAARASNPILKVKPPR